MSLCLLFVSALLLEVSVLLHHVDLFAKGPKFMNMVMTFVLHPLSHYNSITEPRARFLLSLLEHLTIDFPSHFILSIIDVHLDSVSRDKLKILPLSRGFYAIFSFRFPLPTTSPSYVP